MTDVLRFTVKANTYAELVDQASDEISRLLDGNLTGVKWSMDADRWNESYIAHVTVKVKHTEIGA